MSDPKLDEQHESVWLLLPWHANGTLAPAERRLVEDHLAGCPSCREEMTRCNGLAAALRGREEIAPSPHPLQLARLMERIEASERGFDALSENSDAGAIGGRRRGGERGASLLGDTPRPVRWALAGQLAALVLLSVALAFGPARRFEPGKPAPESPASPAGAVYHTLSAPSARAAFPAAASAAGTAAPQIRVVFADAATEKQMREVLLSTRGRLVDGPSPLGAYTLELPAPPPAAAAPPAGSSRSAVAGDAARASAAARASHAEAAPDSVGIVLAYLRSQPIVRFAEPVAGTGTPATSSPLPAAPVPGTAPEALRGTPEAPPP